MLGLCRALSTSTSEFAALLTYVSDPCTPRCQLARGVASAHAGQRRLVLVWARGAATVVRVSHPRGNSTRRWWYSPLIYVSLGHTRRHDRGPVLAEWANGTHPSPRNSGLQRIYTSEKFAILRFCMFTYQLDLGSLAIWQYSLRTSCDYLRGAPGSAALHDASWRGGGSIQRQPSTLNRSVAEFLTDLMACVTLLADGKVRTEIGPLRDVASLHEKLRDVRVTWPYGRACDWKELRGSSMAIWSDLE